MEALQHLVMWRIPIAAQAQCCSGTAAGKVQFGIQIVKLFNLVGAAMLTHWSATRNSSLRPNHLISSNVLAVSPGNSYRVRTTKALRQVLDRTEAV